MPSLSAADYANGNAGNSKLRKALATWTKKAEDNHLFNFVLQMQHTLKLGLLLQDEDNDHNCIH